VPLAVWYPGLGFFFSASCLQIAYYRLPVSLSHRYPATPVDPVHPREYTLALTVEL